MKRLIYLCYYLKKLNRIQFLKFFNHVRKHGKIPGYRLLFDVIASSLRYNISLLEYFQFEFYKLDNDQRKKWAGTGYMYEFQLIMNPLKERVILDDKTLFYRNYKEFIKHCVADIEDIKKNEELLGVLLNNSTGKIVFKVFNGKCGQQVLIKSIAELEETDLIEFMTNNGYDLAEEYIVQHPLLMKLSPSAVNTVRIITQLNTQGVVEILGCRLRISVNSGVDNMAAGNIAAPIDDVTGTITGPAVYSDITKPDVFVHPITGETIVGFQIPFWNETIAMTKAAAKLHPQNRSIGWDIAMTENGPDMIEGNHDWCKLVWQLPVRQGLKPVLEKHLAEHKQ